MAGLISRIRWRAALSALVIKIIHRRLSVGGRDTLSSGIGTIFVGNGGIILQFRVRVYRFEIFMTVTVRVTLITFRCCLWAVSSF